MSTRAKRSRPVPRSTTSAMVAGRWTTSSGSSRATSRRTALSNSSSRSLGRDDLRERPVPVVRKLPMRSVDDHRRRAVDIEGHVADHTDDFVFAAGGEALTGDAFEWNAWKCRAGEVRAHNDAERRTHVITLVEAASRQQRNSEGREHIPADDAVLHREAAALDRRPGQRSGDDANGPGVKASGGGKTGDAACCCHAGDCYKPCRQFFLEGHSPLSVVANRWQIDLHGEDTLGANAEVHLLQPLKAQQQDTGSRNQRQRECDLCGSERAAQPCESASAGRRTRQLTQRFDRRRSGEMQGGRDPTGHGGSGGGHESEDAARWC